MDLMIANTHLGCQLSYTQFDNFSQFLTLSFLHILSYTHIQTNILILLPIIIYICMHDSDRWYKFCVCDRVSRNFGYLQTHSRNFEELERGCNFHFFFFCYVGLRNLFMKKDQVQSGYTNLLCKPKLHQIKHYFKKINFFIW